MPRSCRNILLASLMSLTCGCASFWHDMQPHRIHRLNRGAAPSLSPEFTRAAPPRRNQLVRLDRPRKPPAIKANSAEVSVARGQSSDD